MKKNYIVDITRVKESHIAVKITGAESREDARRIAFANAERGDYDRQFADYEEENGSDNVKFAIYGCSLDNPYEEWESLVIATVAGLFDCTYADAEGIVEAQPFLLNNAWANGLNEQETAQLIKEESRS